MPKNGWAIALVGGAGEVRPPNSEWGEPFLGPSVFSRGVLGTAAPKNNRPKVGVPKPPGGKKAKKRVGYSMGGGLLFLGEVCLPDSK